MVLPLFLPVNAVNKDDANSIMGFFSSENLSHKIIIQHLIQIRNSTIIFVIY